MTRNRTMFATTGRTTILRHLAAAAAAAACATALASEAETSATAGSNRFNRNGTAAATARYEGDVGFARTDTRSGRVNLARGVAVGFDEDGLSLSVSNAIAGRFGPGLATNFNLSIGLDGEVSHSTGVAVTHAPIHQTVSAGGSTTASRFGGGSTSVANGFTDPFGTARATTHSYSSGKSRPGLEGHRVVRRVIVRRH